MEASCSRKRKRPLNDNDDDGEESDQMVDGQTLKGRVCRDIDDLDDEEEEPTEDEIYNEALKVQEPETEVQYDGIQVTPFNLQDELEEGYFDKTGNFIFQNKKDLDETNNDTWAESIDWSRVENSSTIRNQGSRRSELEPEPELEPEQETPVDPVECYRKMLRIMRSDETVQKTIRRLGNSVPKRRPSKNKFKEPEGPEVIEARQNLDSMIELAHKLLETGDMGVYQKSYDDLEEAINS